MDANEICEEPGGKAADGGGYSITEIIRRNSSPRRQETPPQPWSTPDPYVDVGIGVVYFSGWLALKAISRWLKTDPTARHQKRFLAGIGLWLCIFAAFAIVNNWNP